VYEPEALHRSSDHHSQSIATGKSYGQRTVLCHRSRPVDLDSDIRDRPYTVIYNDGTANRTANAVVSGTPFATFTTPVVSTTTYTLVSVTDASACVRAELYHRSSDHHSQSIATGKSYGQRTVLCHRSRPVDLDSDIQDRPYTVIYNDGTANGRPMQ